MSKKDLSKVETQPPRLTKKSLPNLHSDSFVKVKTKKDLEHELNHVKVDIIPHKQRRNTHDVVQINYPNVMSGMKGQAKMSSGSSDFVYVNPAFVGSTHSVHQPKSQVPPAPVTSVVREQYWTCSKWPTAQRMLALAVGVLVGIVIGLVLTLSVTAKINKEDNVFGNLFRSSVPD